MGKDDDDDDDNDDDDEDSDGDDDREGLNGDIDEVDVKENSFSCVNKSSLAL